MKQCIIIAGPNGAGKTTFASEFLPREGNTVNFLNADLIVYGLSPFAQEKAAIEASGLLLARIDEKCEGIRQKEDEIHQKYLEPLARPPKVILKTAGRLALGILGGVSEAADRAFDSGGSSRAPRQPGRCAVCGAPAYTTYCAQHTTMMYGAGMHHGHGR